MEDVEIPEWLKRLPLAPVYHPTETEFADPIAYISKIEKEASTFGICKVVPPIPKPSKRHVLSNLNKSLAKCSDLRLDANCDSLPNCSDVGTSVGGNEAGSRAVFTTRHQELGHSLKRIRGSISCKQAGSIKQVWQSGEHYTLNQFESKSKVFARSYLGNVKDLSPLVIESGFWKAACDKPIYIEYANDVPGSAFGQPVESYRHIRKRCRTQRANQGSRKSEGNVASSVNCLQENGKDEEFPEVTCNGDKEGTAGWKLSNSPWNLQVIARSRGSLTRFMPDDVPGVTSPMIYIGMLFSWFAWHVEDHELHSMNFLHLGSPKTWYGIPGDYAFALEDIVREHCYGGELDHLAALSLLGEKTTLLSPEVVVASNIPCCRLIQYPGEFVVTFPRAYHVGFSHGFNCGEAANFATPQWLKVAREAAVRRAAMNYLPMLSHQQLLYLLSMSFISRIPSTLLPGIRSSRFKDRIKEERENLVKKAFIDDMVKENDRLDILLKKESTFGAVYWDPEMLPPTNSFISISAEMRDKNDIQVLCESINEDNDDSLTDMKESSYMNSDEDDLPCGLHVESGALSCVACGILGYPFMSIVQPSENALEFLIQGIEKKKYMLRSLMPCTEFNMDKHRRMTDSGNGASDDHPEKLFDMKDDVDLNARINILKSNPSDTLPCQANSFSGDDLQKKHGNWRNGLQEKMSNVSTNTAHTNFSKSEGRIATDSSLTLSGCASLNPNSCTGGEEPLNAPEVDGYNATRKKWTTSIGFLRPRIFCLEHCLEVEQLLEEHGGANVLLICHSDYPKIKEEAISAAELFGVDFRCKEMKLQTASPADLDLINIAVDDGQQEECEKDWTSSLGVNLKYGVMLRKMSPPKQEKLTLALGGLFSDKVGASNRLNWVSRKCRSQNKEKSLTPSKFGMSKGDQVTEVPMLEPSDDIIGDVCSPSLNNRTQGQGRPRRSAIERDTMVHSEENDLTTVSVSYASSLLAISTRTNIKPGESEAALQIDAAAESFKPSIRSGLHSICLSTTTCYETLQEVHIQMASTKFDLQMAIDMVGSMDSEPSHSVKSTALTATVLSPTESLEQLDIQKVEQDKNATNVLDNRKLGASPAASIQDFDDSRMLSYNPVATSATEGVSVVVNGSKNSELRDSPSSTAECSNSLQKTNDDCGIQVLTDSSNAILDCENFRMKHKNCTLEETRSDACGSAKFVGLPVVPTSAMDDPELQQEMNTRVEANILNDICSQGDECPDDFPAHMGSEQKKQTYKEKPMAKNQFNHTEFVRSPCEGLRCLISRVVPADRQTSQHLKKRKPRVIKNSDGHRKCGAKYKAEEEVYGCDIDGCNMSFSTKAVLRDHKQNRCTHEGCGKRFRSHRYAMHHQRVHINERPLKCVWKGCGMTFKWAWALTEHTRVHTRERPYCCKIKGCGLTFRFVSDFSRHRRRTGHSLGYAQL